MKKTIKDKDKICRNTYMKQGHSRGKNVDYIVTETSTRFYCKKRSDKLKKPESEREEKVI